MRRRSLAAQRHHPGHRHAGCRHRNRPHRPKTPRRHPPRRPRPQQRPRSPPPLSRPRPPTTATSSSPASAPAAQRRQRQARQSVGFSEFGLRRRYRRLPRHQPRRIVQPRSRHHHHPRDHRRRPQHRHPRPRHQLHPRPAQRRAGRDRLDRPHRQRRTPTARSTSTCSRPNCSPSSPSTRARLASMIEGGAAGTVNMRTARPFDNAGHCTSTIRRRPPTTATPAAGATAARWSRATRSAISASWSASPGCAAIAARRLRDDRLDQPEPQRRRRCTQRRRATAPAAATGRFRARCPANAGNGLVTGATIDQAFLLAHNPGPTIHQIDNAIIPRLSRPSDEFGTRDRIQRASARIEWRPSDALPLLRRRHVRPAQERSAAHRHELGRPQRRDDPAQHAGRPERLQQRLRRHRRHLRQRPILPRISARSSRRPNSGGSIRASNGTSPTI